MTQPGSADLFCAVVRVCDPAVYPTPEAAHAPGYRALELLCEAGLRVGDYSLCEPDAPTLKEAVRALAARADLTVLIGGMGLGARDTTLVAVRPLLDHDLPGFGELLRILLHQSEGRRALHCRALLGSVGRNLVAALPCDAEPLTLALRHLLIPELPELLADLGRGVVLS